MLKINQVWTYRRLLVIIVLSVIAFIVALYVINENLLEPGERTFRDREDIVPEKVDEAVYLYGGEFEDNGATVYGFSLSAGEFSSPGPTLRFNMSSTVYVRFLNDGSVPHTWAILRA